MAEQIIRFCRLLASSRFNAKYGIIICIGICVRGTSVDFEEVWKCETEITLLNEQVEKVGREKNAHLNGVACVCHVMALIFGA